MNNIRIIIHAEAPLASNSLITKSVAMCQYNIRQFEPHEYRVDMFSWCDTTNSPIPPYNLSIHRERKRVRRTLVNVFTPYAYLVLDNFQQK